MKINSVLQSVYTPKASSEQTYVEKHKHVTQDFSNPKNKALMSYTPNYYVSFKGEEKSDAIKNYEAFLDKFYEKNKGKEIKEINTFYSIVPTTMSLNMKHIFTHMIKTELLQQKAPAVNEEKLVNALEQVMPEYGISGNAHDYIKQYKEQNQIKKEILFDNNDYGLNMFCAGLTSTLKLPESQRGKNREILEKWIKEIRNSNPPVLDENCLNRMKEALNKGAFKSFNDKLLKIRAQELANSAYPPQQCAQDIYKDSVEKKIPPFENRKLYDYVSKNDEKLKFMLERIYGFAVNAYTSIFNLRSIDLKHKVLLIDPGFGAHIDELADFVNKENIDTKNIEPFELRQKFSKYLGTETVYCAVYSDSPQECAEAVKKDGNYSSVYKNEKNAIDAIKFYLGAKGDPDDSIFGRIICKIRNPSDNNELLSVSSEYDIAASSMKLRGHPKSPVVVMKVNIPRISLIKQKGNSGDMPWDITNKDLCAEHRRFYFEYESEKTDAFVPFCITPDSIEDVVIDTHTSDS